MNAQVAAAWQDFENWWAKHLGNEYLQYLNPGATDKELAALEAFVGQPLPADFVDAYRRHNGQQNFYEDEGEDKLLPGLFFGLPMLDIEEIIEELGNWRELIDELEGDGSMEEFNEGQTSVPPGHARPVYAHRMWVPFADDSGGNFLAIDLAPDEAGTVGQVIVFGREEETKYVLAPSFGAYLAHVAGELRRGNFVLEEEEPGEWSLNIGQPEGTTHYFDALPALYGGEA